MNRFQGKLFKLPLSVANSVDHLHWQLCVCNRFNPQIERISCWHKIDIFICLPFSPSELGLKFGRMAQVSCTISSSWFHAQRPRTISVNDDHNRTWRSTRAKRSSKCTLTVSKVVLFRLTCNMVDCHGSDRMWRRTIVKHAKLHWQWCDLIRISSWRSIDGIARFDQLSSITSDVGLHMNRWESTNATDDWKHQKMPPPLNKSGN